MEEIQLYKDKNCTQPIAPIGNITVLKSTLVFQADATGVSDWGFADLDDNAEDEAVWEILAQAEGPVLIPWLCIANDNEYGYALGKYNPTDDGYYTFYINVWIQGLQTICITMWVNQEDCYFTMVPHS